MAQVNIMLSLRKRPWFGAALTALSIGCALASICSDRLAGWLSDKGAGFLARHAMRIEVG